MNEDAAFGDPLDQAELFSEEQLGTRISRRNGTAWLAVAGELDAFSGRRLREAIEEVEALEPDVLVLDLRGVTFIDSSGLAVVLATHQRAREHERELKLVIAGSSAVEGLFETIRARDHLAVVDDAKALAATA